MTLRLSVCILIFVQMLYNSYMIEAFSFKLHAFYSVDLVDNQTESNLIL